MRKILLSLVLVLAINLSSCKGPEDVPNKVFTLELTYIDGYKTQKSWTLPSESRFYIESNRGSYTLTGQSMDQCTPCAWDLEEAVIRYEIISVK